MNFPTSRVLLGCTALLALPSLTIAQSIVLPTIATNVQGNDGQNRHFEDNPFRSQQVVLGSSLLTGAATTATIDGIGYRPDSAPTGATFTDVVIRAGHTTQTPELVDATFANNITGTMTVVYDTAVDGPITFPIYISDILNEAPFTDITFNSPFTFDINHADGPNLILDFTSSTAPGGFIGIDGARAGGHWQNFGQSGDVSAPDPFAQYRLLCNGSSQTGQIGGNRSGMAPGDTFGMQATAPAYMANTPAAFLWGFGPNPAPTDLSPFGAPSNFLYVTANVSTPAVWNFSPIQGWSVIQNISIGDDPANIGLQYNAQMVAVDLPANALGVVLTNGLEMHIGHKGVDHPVGQVASNDHLATDGFVQYGTSAGIWGGAVLKVFGPSF